MNRKLKRQMVKEARATVARLCPDLPLDAACLFLAWAICASAKARGHKLLLFAGTAYWPRVTPTQDDGITDTHFGYEWQGLRHPATQLALASDTMPEMHCWAGDPSTGDLIDLTTGSWPAQCQKLHGLPWRAPRPPSYIWCPPWQLPPTTRYEAHKDAGQTALAMLTKCLGAPQ